jgi:hypothetical protein
MTAAIALVASSCGADRPSPNEKRTIAIYSAVIRAVVTRAATTPTTSATRTVFVLAADSRAPISLEVQAGIVQTLHQVATIRFIDQRSEAIDAADPRRPVHEGGVLVTLGEVPSGRNDVTVEVQRYERVDTSATYLTKLHRTGSTWTTDTTA